MYKIRNITSLFIIKLVLVSIALTIFTSIDDAEAKRVRVKGYYRKDGTYVRPHYRTAPDGNPYNNYSYPGNYNPNTGKTTTGDPAKYLERYYNTTKRIDTSPEHAEAILNSLPSILPKQSTPDLKKETPKIVNASATSTTDNITIIALQIQTLEQQITALREKLNNLKNNTKPPLIYSGAFVTVKGNHVYRFGDWITLDFATLANDFTFRFASFGNTDTISGSGKLYHNNEGTHNYTLKLNNNPTPISLTLLPHIK